MKKFMNLALVIAFIWAPVYADQTTINNNTAPNNPQQIVVPQCPPANQNNIYDPRVPPAGVYQSQSGTTYTTGEKKPYIVDNNCNNSTAPAQPYVFVQPRG